MSSRASKTHLWALLSVWRSSTQPECTSVAVRVRDWTKGRPLPNQMSRSGGPCQFQKSRAFVGIGVVRADGNLLFKEFPRLCPAFFLQGKLFPVLLQ